MRTFHHIQQRSARWTLLRIGKATSSNMHQIMARGKGADTYRNEILSQIDLLYSVHSGHCTFEEAFDQFQVSTRAMRVGNDYEALAVAEYCQRAGVVVDPIGFIEFDRYPIGASTDGLVDDDGILEVKVPNSATHRATIEAGVMPSKHIVQVQSELWISGKAYCTFISFDHRLRPGTDLFALRVGRDESKIQQIMDVAIPFAESLPKDPFDFDLDDIVVGGDDIELDWGDKTNG